MQPNAYRELAGEKENAEVWKYSPLNVTIKFNILVQNQYTKIDVQVQKATRLYKKGTSSFFFFSLKDLNLLKKRDSHKMKPEAAFNPNR